MLKVNATEFILPKAEGMSGDDACAYEIINNESMIAVLCDGVGSAKQGGAAARQSVKFFLQQYKIRPKNWSIEQTLETFTTHMNRLLFKESMTQYEEIQFLTTLCVAVIEGKKLYTLNLGDSHIYLQRDGVLELLSEDHNMDEEHMSHVLTQACGLSENVEVNVKVTDLQVDDKIILCSDGVYTLIDDDALNKKITQGLSAKLIINSITKGHADNERDDASLQIFTIKELSELEEVKALDLEIPEKLSKSQIIDGYTLIAPLMEHARIWKVSKDNQAYVMKFPMGDDEIALDNFVHEAWYARQIQHESFGKAWIEDNRTKRYYMMELIEGKNVLEFLHGEKMSVDTAINMAKFLLGAENHLLTLGLVHGDIKPENILIYRKKDSLGTEFKMVDFGSIVEIFATNSRAGTPSYLAPERFTGSNINEATEIFAIGVTLYYALTAKLPYGEIEPFQTPSFKTAKSPRSYNKNIPMWLESVIMRSIAIDTDERYEHYSEFEYELKNPEKVKPYFKKDTPLIERDPIQFYKIAFYISFLGNIAGIIWNMM